MSDEDDSSDFDFKSAKLFVNSAYADFVSKHVFMITYDEVFNSDWDDSSFPVSFQIFLYSGHNNKAYESSSSYVTFKYKSRGVCSLNSCALSGFNYNNAGSLQELIITCGHKSASHLISEKRVL